MSAMDLMESHSGENKKVKERSIPDYVDTSHEPATSSEPVRIPDAISYLSPKHPNICHRRRIKKRKTKRHKRHQSTIEKSATDECESCMSLEDFNQAEDYFEGYEYICLQNKLDIEQPVFQRHILDRKEHLLVNYENVHEKNSIQELELDHNFRTNNMDGNQTQKGNLKAKQSDINFVISDVNSIESVQESNKQKGNLEKYSMHKALALEMTNKYSLLKEISDNYEFEEFAISEIGKIMRNIQGDIAETKLIENDLCISSHRTKKINVDSSLKSMNNLDDGFQVEDYYDESGGHQVFSSDLEDIQNKNLDVNRWKDSVEDDPIDHLTCLSVECSELDHEYECQKYKMDHNVDRIIEDLSQVDTHDVDTHTDISKADHLDVKDPGKDHLGLKKLGSWAKNAQKDYVDRIEKLFPEAPPDEHVPNDGTKANVSHQFVEEISEIYGSGIPLSKESGSSGESESKNESVSEIEQDKTIISASSDLIGCLLPLDDGIKCDESNISRVSLNEAMCLSNLASDFDDTSSSRINCPDGSSNYGCTSFGTDETDRTPNISLNEALCVSNHICMLDDTIGLPKRKSLDEELCLSQFCSSKNKIKFNDVSAKYKNPVASKFTPHQRNILETSLNKGSVGSFEESAMENCDVFIDSDLLATRFDDGSYFTVENIGVLSDKYDQEHDINKNSRSIHDSNFSSPIQVQLSDESYGDASQDKKSHAKHKDSRSLESKSNKLKVRVSLVSTEITNSGEDPQIYDLDLTIGKSHMQRQGLCKRERIANIGVVSNRSNDTLTSDTLQSLDVSASPPRTRSRTRNLRKRRSAYDLLQEAEAFLEPQSPLPSQEQVYSQVLRETTKALRRSLDLQSQERRSHNHELRRVIENQTSILENILEEQVSKSFYESFQNQNDNFEDNLPKWAYYTVLAVVVPGIIYWLLFL